MRPTPSSSPRRISNTDSGELRDLRRQLRQISIQVERVEGRLAEIEQGGESRRPRPLSTAAEAARRQDSHGHSLTVGSRVSFKATKTTAAGTGRIVRFSHDSSRAIIRRDGPSQDQAEVHRAPYNTTLIITLIE